MIQKTPYFLGLDLNIDSASRTVTAVPAAESIDASRPARICAVDASSSTDDVPPVRGALCRGTQGQELLVPRSVFVHGLRAADLPGVDVSIGRTRTAGNDTLYRRLLAMFADSQHSFAARFSAARASGDILAATRAAHDLKSEAGTIGASAVQLAAEALEDANAHQAADGVIDQLLETVARALGPVIAGLQALRK
jgi:HPt (histidine-containing phosphotransfer) domain-containing protein